VNTGSVLPATGLRGGASQGTRIGVKLKSINEIRWENIVRQQVDIGCGAAALATILTYYFDFPATEMEMFEPLLNLALKEAGPDVEQVGFSLRHIRDVAAQGGLAAAAFRVAESDLHQVKIPGIVRITIHGYDHFAVFKEARGGHVYLADPAFGNTSYRLADFSRIWSGVVMGFARRSGDRPLDHLLLVGVDDETNIESKEIMRAASANVTASIPATRMVTWAKLSTWPNVQPKVSGLQSVFPTFLYNRIEF
jgi:predicted double-glycine peptidase